MPNGFVINARSLDRRLSGVERYTSEVARRLGTQVRREAPGGNLPAGIGHFWEQVILPGKVRDGELLWSPANTGPLAITNQVLTLHDIHVLEHPEWFHPAFAAWYRWALPRLVRRVRRVLTVSEHSRKQIQKYFSLPDDRVIAIAGGVDLAQFKPAPEAAIYQVRQRYGLIHDYVLFVGTIEPRKNLPWLLNTWRMVRTRFPRVDLAIAGDPVSHFTRALPVDSIGSRDLQEGIHFLGYVADSDLAALYSGAKILLLPSLTEGFGLTALEAMACGLPVIASKSGALPETVGEGGWLVPPLNSSAWADAIYCLLANRDCWLDYQRRGLENARRFSWDNTAAGVWQELEAARQEGS
ncbi:MAG: glycosyltransferase family 4 protein [Omnitrophica WOR_2 bacterium]